ISRDGKLETIDVKIPAGVKEGSRVRIKGKGQHTNGEPGDLFIVTRVLPHPYFRREGLDVQLDLPISMYEALEGAKVEVPPGDGGGCGGGGGGGEGEGDCAGGGEGDFGGLGGDGGAEEDQA